MSDFEADILSPHEDRRREFKRSMPWDEAKPKVVKTAMAMANTRDGGLIIVGVKHEDGEYVAEGMTEEHLRTYDDDNIQAAINRHADPPVVCRVYRENIDDAKFLVIEVDQFGRQPVVCKRDGPDGIREGAIYVRPYRQPETCEVRSQTEMRELLDVAIEQGVREFVARAGRAGVEVRTGPTDEERFEEERQEFLGHLEGSRWLEQRRYLFGIRPSTYDPERITPLPRLLDIVREHEIRWYGWTYPTIFRSDTSIEQRAAGSPASADGAPEFWRMYQSGQFLYAMGYREDERGDEPEKFIHPVARQMAPPDFRPRGIVNLHHLILFVTFTFEFAARLATVGVIADAAEVSIELGDARDRVLCSTDFRRPVRQFFRATAPSITSTVEMDVDQLVAAPRDEAAKAVTALLYRFGWEDVTPENVRSIQESNFGSPS